MTSFHKLIYTTAMVFACIQPVSATVITGNLIPGSGNQTLITNGGFESGLANWSQLNFGKGSFDTSSTAFSGTTSAQSVPFNAFTGPGFALQSDAITVTAGATYILSGYINTANNSSSQTYIDLSDASFDIDLGIGEIVNNVTDWQFIYGTFIPNTSSVRVRLVQDLNVAQGDTVLFDNIGITLAQDFQVVSNGPSPIPVPATPALLSLGLLGIGFLRKQHSGKK